MVQLAAHGLELKGIADTVALGTNQLKPLIVQLLLNIQDVQPTLATRFLLPLVRINQQLQLQHRGLMRGFYFQLQIV